MRNWPTKNARILLKKISVGLLLTGCFWSSIGSCAEQMEIEILVVTEEAFPLHFAKDNHLEGAAVRLVEKVLSQAHIAFQIQIYPWARAYRLAKSESNVMIFSLSRTKLREAEFKWVGEIIPLQYELIRLKSRPEISANNLHDLKDFNIGVIRKGAVHEYLLSKSHKKLTVIDEREQNFKMLLDGRVDMISHNLVTLHFACEELQVDCDKLEPVIRLEDISTGLYMAFSKSTDDAIVERARKAFLAVHDQGEYDLIMRSILQPTKKDH